MCPRGGGGGRWATTRSGSLPVTGAVFGEGQDVEVLGDKAGRIDLFAFFFVGIRLDRSFEDDQVALFADLGVGEALAHRFRQKRHGVPVGFGGPGVTLFDLTVGRDGDVGDFVFGVDGTDAADDAECCVVDHVCLQWFRVSMGRPEGRRFWSGETPEATLVRPAGEAEDTGVAGAAKLFSDFAGTGSLPRPIPEGTQDRWRRALI